MSICIYVYMYIEDASRDHRPLKRISADVLLRRLQMSFQDGLCNVVHVLRVPSFTKKVSQILLKKHENPSQIWPKIDEKRVGKHPEAAKSTNEATKPLFLYFFGAPGPDRDYDFDPFWLQNCRKVASKKQLKTQAL